LAEADRLWKERLNRQQDAEAQQQTSRNQALNEQLHPQIDMEQAAAQRHEQKAKSTPATQAEYEKFQREERERRKQEEVEKLRQQQNLQRERNKQPER
jgi:hypothetical protein